METKIDLEEDWDIIIRPEKKWLDFNFREIWHYRDLIALFVRRDFVAYYKQTILGPLWFLIQPLFTMVMFIIVFGKIAQVPTTTGIPMQLFYLSGIVNWNYFADCLNKTSASFITNSAVFGKVYFPRLVVPISIVLSSLITYCIQLFLFLVILIYHLFIHDFHLHLSLTIFIFPLLIAEMGLFGLGCGIIVSSLTTKYKDLSFAVVFGVQLWMYATPIVYPLSRVPEKWQWLFYLNPMASVAETFRSIVFGMDKINWELYSSGWIITLVVLTTGIMLFNRVEKTFMDTI
ncbi:MAG TPA: ABC transporter permease [Puia sp.]|nr:ABC transporter permease [Puia sp.]